MQQRDRQLQGEDAGPRAATNERFDSVQALRAFAALYVVLLHAYVYIGLPRPDEAAVSFFRFFAFAGNSGVDLFFVISGFITACPKAGATTIWSACSPGGCLMR